MPYPPSKIVKDLGWGDPRAAGVVADEIRILAGALDDPTDILNAYVGKYRWGCGDNSLSIDFRPDLTGQMERLTFKNNGTMDSRPEILRIRLLLKQNSPTIVVDGVIQQGYETPTPNGTEYSVSLIDEGKALQRSDFFAPIPREEHSMDYPC